VEELRGKGLLATARPPTTIANRTLTGFQGEIENERTLGPEE
jgi:hypothetical protein